MEYIGVLMFLGVLVSFCYLGTSNFSQKQSRTKITYLSILFAIGCIAWLIATSAIFSRVIGESHDVWVAFFWELVILSGPLIIIHLLVLPVIVFLGLRARYSYQKSDFEKTISTLKLAITIFAPGVIYMGYLLIPMMAEWSVG